jgi:hypothetical protein
LIDASSDIIAGWLVHPVFPSRWCVAHGAGQHRGASKSGGIGCIGYVTEGERAAAPATRQLLAGVVDSVGSHSLVLV